MDAATFPTELLGEITGLVPITMGMSGAVVHAVTTARGEYVLRVHGPTEGSWDKVVPMQRLAAEHGVAPRLAYADDATRTTVSARISGPPLGAALQDPDVRPKVFASLAQQLATLHSIDASGLVADDPVPLARGLWASQSTRAGFPMWSLSLGERIDGWAAALHGDVRRVLSHGDLNPANILWDGERVWLVDWERAGLAHPYIDLASLSNLLSLPDAAANKLLEMQEGGALGVEQLALFGALRDFTRLVYGLLFLSLASELEGTGIAQREAVPALSDCWRKVFTGELSMKTARGQALIGAALLSQVSAAHAGKRAGLEEVWRWTGDATWNGLRASALAATAMTLVALVLGRGLARRSPSSGWLDGLATLAFILPSSIVGVGIVGAWNRPATNWVYASFGILVVGFVARYSAVATRTFAAAVAQVPASLEDAARTVGAGYLRRLWLLAGMARRELVATFVLALVFALRDLETAALFYPPGGEPLTVRIFTLEANGPPAVVSALALLHVLITFAAASVGLIALARRRSP